MNTRIQQKLAADGIDLQWIQGHLVLLKDNPLNDIMALSLKEGKRGQKTGTVKKIEKKWEKKLTILLYKYTILQLRESKQRTNKNKQEKSWKKKT